MNCFSYTKSMQSAGSKYLALTYGEFSTLSTRAWLKTRVWFWDGETYRLFQLFRRHDQLTSLAANELVFST